jgi:tRNA-specific 2-thiouridylase
MRRTRDGCETSSESPAVEAAREVASQLGIPHRTVEYVDAFEERVIAEFAREYASGRTPNPCVRCNRVMKFGAVLEQARAAGADRLATGHYARLEQRDGRTALRRAAEGAPDQTYFLSGLSQEQLAAALFPLGGMTKEETRATARRFNLPCSEHPGSMDICFAQTTDFRDIVAAREGEPPPGPIRFIDGTLLGEHQGLTRHTIGQRKGIGIAAPEPLYVVRLDAAANTLVVGHERHTWSVALVADSVNWVSIPEPREPFACTAQVRYNQRPVPCNVTPSGDTLSVTFDPPVRAIAPGQWVVLYDGEYVLGNGQIRDFTPCS